MRRAARLGFKLFAKPATFSFDWQDHAAGGADEIVVYPALVQLTDDNGQLLQRELLVAPSEEAHVS